MGTQHSVIVADVGSNPAGSILPSVEKNFVWGENAEIISLSNLTLPSHYSILNLTECLHYVVFDGSDTPEPFPFVRSVGSPQPSKASSQQACNPS
jgi:hypothetical protein